MSARPLCSSALGAGNSCAKQKTAARPLTLMGPSGVGKGTLKALLKNKFPGAFEESVSTTTRKPRSKERHGVEYNFENKEDFDVSLFAECLEINGNYYGTSICELERVAATGRIPLLEIHYKSAQKIEAKIDELPFETPFKLMISCAGGLRTLESRILGRQQIEARKLEARLNEARNEFEFADKNPDFFDAVLFNDGAIRDSFYNLCAIVQKWYPGIRAKNTLPMALASCNCL